MSSWASLIGSGSFSRIGRLEILFRRKVAKLPGHRSLVVLKQNYTRIEDRALLGAGRRLEERLLGPKVDKRHEAQRN